MAWPFSTPASGPTSFSGPGATVPTSATEIAGGAAVWLLGAHFINNDSVERTVILSNSSGGIVYQATIPPGGSPPNPYAPTFEPSTGLKWSVSGGSAVVGHVWGY